jgi:uncharacterized protein (TIGR00369 family)
MSSDDALSPDALFDAVGDEAGDLRIPPRCFEEMNGTITAVDREAGILRARFPVEARYENPTGAMQGGFVSAAIDNVLGPLSYLVAPPSATTQLNLTFLRPVGPELEHIEVQARVEERAGRTLQLSARVTDPAGTTLVTCTSTCRILRR